MLKVDCPKTHWARWVWEDTGPGRYHAMADVGLGIALDAPRPLSIAVKTACGKVRELPEEYGVHAPPRDECCPECLSLDDLKGRLETDADMDDLTFADHPLRVVVPA